MNDQPGISVIIPTRNRSALVYEAVRTALDQDWSPLEVVVIDDASTDDTVARLEGLDDPRVRVIRRPSAGGPATARNDGVRNALHSYVAFLDSDNTFAADKLRVQMEHFLGQGGQGLSFTGYTLELDPDRQDVILTNWSSDPEAVLEKLFESCCVNTSTVVMPKELLLDSGLFRADLVCCEDHELWFRLALGGQPFFYLPRSLTRYRFHSGSISANEGLVARTSELVVGSALAAPTLPVQLKSRGNAYRARWALSSAGRFLAAGNKGSALWALARAARLNPRSVRPGWLLLAARIVVSRRPPAAS